MKNAIPHLHRDRHGTYYFRITQAGRTVKRSLRTKNAELATMRAACLNWEWDTMSRPTEPTVDELVQALKSGRAKKFDMVLPDGTEVRGINTDDDARRAKELMVARIEAIGKIEPHLAPLRPEYRKAQGPKFRVVASAYVAEQRGASLHEEKNSLDKEATYAAFADQFDNPNIGAIDGPMVSAFKQGQLKRAKAGRVNAKIGHLSQLFEWAIPHGHAEENPFEGTRIGSKSELAKKVQHFKPFTAADLKRIFDPTTYPGYATKPHFHWIPFLLLYTGARPDEIASLRLQDIHREQGIDYFEVLAGKTSSSVRKIPLHKAVRASGFMTYLAERRKAEPRGMLFPLLTPTKNGYIKNVSRRFNEQYLVELGVAADDAKRLYSFRSTFITRMSELNTNTAMLMALVGHFEQDAVDLSSPHFKNYQGAKLIAALQKTIDRFDVKLPLAF